MRNYDALCADIIRAIPITEEIAELTDEQIQDLRKISTAYDNRLYLAWLKRNELSA